MGNTLLRVYGVMIEHPSLQSEVLFIHTECVSIGMNGITEIKISILLAISLSRLLRVNGPQGFGIRAHSDTDGIGTRLQLRPDSQINVLKLGTISTFINPVRANLSATALIMWVRFHENFLL